MDVSWLWDVNFERLADETLNTLTLSGIRRYDLALRFKYCDIKIDSVTDDMKAAIESVLKTDTEVCYVLVNYTALFKAQKIMLDMKKELEANN